MLNKLCKLFVRRDIQEYRCIECDDGACLARNTGVSWPCPHFVPVEGGLYEAGITRHDDEKGL